MLTLTEREATLGSSINTRCERHGDEDVTALDIPLSGMALDEKELNILLQDPHAFGALYVAAGARGSMSEPKLKVLGPLKLKDKIEGAEVSLWIGMAKEPVVIRDCKLAKVTLELQTGGTTLLSLQVQCTPTIDKHITKLLEQLGHAITVEIRVDGYGEQRDLLQDEAA